MSQRFSCLVLPGLSISAAAQTPDAETPALEAVCDPLRDEAPGLYGLCVAYCEAQDCDAEESGSRSCETILRNYERKMRPEDPEMPCLPLATPCPCFDGSDLMRLSVTQCNDVEIPPRRITSLGSPDSACSFGNLRGDQALLSGGVDFGTCRLLDFHDNCGLDVFVQITLRSEEEVTACRELLLKEVNARELVCLAP